nr:unnamed protein product [Callosobruchus chinensis]
MAGGNRKSRNARHQSHPGSQSSSVKPRHKLQMCQVSPTRPDTLHWGFSTVTASSRTTAGSEALSISKCAP